MKSSPKPAELIQAHVELQMGSYFSEDKEISQGVRFVSSKKIDDFYWNFGYDFKTSLKELPFLLADVREYAKKIDRSPTIYLCPDCLPSDIDQILSDYESESEVWMVLGDDHKLSLTSKSEIDIQLISIKEMHSFISIFRDAYGSGIDEPGYSDLPEAYPESIIGANPEGGVEIAHFLGLLDGEPAGIASIYYKKPYAGLYNVGTKHKARRHGLAKAMSEAAIAHALDQKCEVIFLQTEADSVVEELYKTIGFNRIFVGKYIIMNED